MNLGTSADNNASSFCLDDNNNVARRVTDDVAHDKLDAVISALGGSGNTTATISVVNAALADTEYSFSLPANCKGFFVRSRKISRLKFSYSTGVLTTYVSIPFGGFWSDNNFYSSQTIYFSSSLAGNDIEIVTYV